MNFKDLIPKTQNFDPSWVIKLAESQIDDCATLCIALENCTNGVWEGKNLVDYGIWNIIDDKKWGLLNECGYIQFINSDNANNIGADWQIKGGVMLNIDKHRFLVFDILMDLRVGGIEFLFCD